jgi:hypothetical protein
MCACSIFGWHRMLRLSAFSKDGALLTGQRFSPYRLPRFRPGDRRTPAWHHGVKNEFEPLAILYRRQTGAGGRIETSERLRALLHCCFSVLVVLVEARPNRYVFALQRRVAPELPISARVSSTETGSRPNSPCVSPPSRPAK